MMAQSNREADEMLDVYIYDHLVKKKLHNTAKSFMTEAKVSPDPFVIDAPGGFLFEWWSVFWDVLNARTNEKHSQSAVEYGLNVYIYDYLVKKKLRYTANSFMTEVKVSPDHVAIDTLGGFLFEWWSLFWDVFIARTNEKHSESAAEMKQPNPMNTETFQPHMDAGTSHQGQMVQGNHQGGVSAALQQLQSHTQQIPVVTLLDEKSLINMPPVQQSSSQKQDPLLSQQSKSTGAGNTVGPSNSQPSTPPTHTPVEGVGMKNMPKGPIMYGSDAIDGLANQLDDMEPFGDVGSLEDKVESFSSEDGGDGGSLFNTLKRNPSESGAEYIEPQQGKAKEQMKQTNPMNTETSQPHMDAGMAPLKSGTSHHGEMVKGNDQGGGVSVAQQQLKSRTQQTPLGAGEGESRKRCKCKKSKCVQLLCECFATGVYCTTEPPCSCTDCFNKPIHEDTVLATARKKYKSRNPLGFAPRVIRRSSDSVQETREDDASKTPASARHRRGCNCKISNCVMRYCTCFQGGVGCSIRCKCEGCQNNFGTKSSVSKPTKED